MEKLPLQNGGVQRGVRERAGNHQIFNLGFHRLCYQIHLQDSPFAVIWSGKSVMPRQVLNLVHANPKLRYFVLKRSRGGPPPEMFIYAALHHAGPVLPSYRMSFLYPELPCFSHLLYFIS